MTAVETLFAEIAKLQTEGLKPFQIAKHLLSQARAQRHEVSLRGTLNDSELVFETGEVITFDGSLWRYHAPRRKQGKVPGAPR